MAEAEAPERDDVKHWLSVIARALVYEALQHGELQNADLATQAKFVLGFGLSRRQAADLLGSTPGSLKAALSRAKKSQGRRAHGKKKKA